MDPSPRDRQIKHVRKLGDKWIRSERVPDATWRRKEHRIVIKKIGCLSAIQPFILLTLHRTADLHRDRGARDQLITIVHPAVLSSDGQRWIHLSIVAHGIRSIAIVHSARAQSDGDGTSWKNSTIVARSSRDRGDFGAGSTRIRLPSIGKRLTKLEHHD